MIPLWSSFYQVESFILDQEDLDNPIMKTASELLLSSATDGVDLRTVDPETQTRLEALLEAAGTTTWREPDSALQGLTTNQLCWFVVAKLPGHTVPVLL